MEFVVVADDLTGATDTGGAFAARGFRTVVRRVDDAVDWPDAVDVGVVDTDTRYDSAEVAASRVTRVLSDVSDAQVYLKVDSTLRGNLVASIDAAMEATGATLGVVAPAFPATGRGTVGGYHLIDGTPVDETAAGDDPMAPVRTSHLPTLLRDAERPVTSVGLDAVRTGGVQAAFETASAPDGGLVVCDATTDAHLDQVARSAAAIDGSVLYVGSAGLAGHVRTGPPRPVLGVVGSVAPETFAQLDRLPSDLVIELDPEELFADGTAEVERAMDAVLDRFGTGRPVAVTAARERADVTATRRAGRDAGFTPEETAARVETALATVARSVHERGQLDGLFLTGGAVADATLTELDATGVSLAGRSVSTGIPLGYVQGGPADGLPVLTKAGGFGSETAIVNCLHNLETYHDR